MSERLMAARTGRMIRPTTARRPWMARRRLKWAPSGSHRITYDIRYNVVGRVARMGGNHSMKSAKLAVSDRIHCDIAYPAGFAVRRFAGPVHSATCSQRNLFTARVRSTRSQCLGRCAGPCRVKNISGPARRASSPGCIGDTEIPVFGVLVVRIGYPDNCAWEARPAIMPRHQPGPN
jgi:hypothetical protein